jgi:hypothetical protein
MATSLLSRGLATEEEEHLDIDPTAWIVDEGDSLEASVAEEIRKFILHNGKGIFCNLIALINTAAASRVSRDEGEADSTVLIRRQYFL